MTQEQLHEQMKYHLTSFNNVKPKDERLTIIDEETVHNTVLSPTDGFKKTKSSQTLYKEFVDWSFEREKKKKEGPGRKNPWPAGWPSLSVRDLAAKLLAILLLFFCTSASAQFEINVAAAKTSLRDNAINFGIHYLKSFDSIWTRSDYFSAGKNTIFTIAPQADIEFGSDGAFSSIVVTASASLVKFRPTTVAGIEIVDSRRTFHVFPISVGAETNSLFSYINGLVEAGWVPWYQTHGNELLRRTRVAFFVQAGYKFKNDTTGNTAIGGEIDQSLEEPGKVFGRLKGSGEIDTKKLISLKGLDMGLFASGDVWYDFVNSAIYHRIDIQGRLFITQEQYLQFGYQYGSGAPNFNSGDQYSVGLTIVF